MFKHVKHFDVQNPLISSLILEADSGKKKDWSKFLDKAPDTRGLELRSRFNKLQDGREFFNRENSNNNNNNTNGGLLPPPSPPRFDFLGESVGQQRPLPNIENLLNDKVNNFPPPPAPPPSLPPFQNTVPVRPSKIV